MHGIRSEFLLDKPRFADAWPEIRSFVSDAEVIIHNAPFDVSFLDHELARLGEPAVRLENFCRILDTLAMARQLFPGQRNNLDALCRRFRVDNSARQRHGALLDAEILADVYLAMTGGQAVLELGANANPASVDALDRREPRSRRTGIHSRDSRANPDESAAHARQLAGIDEKSGGRCLWLHPEAD